MPRDIHPGRDHDPPYPLDFLSPQRHVVTELSTNGGGLSPADLSASLSVQPGDLQRIRLFEGVADDQAAKLFLVNKALEALDEQVSSEQGRYQLAVPAEDLQYISRDKKGHRRRNRLHPFEQDEPRIFLDPFRPGIGIFAQGLRKKAITGSKDDTALRASLAAGYLEHLPIVKDQYGAILVGSRRLQIAEELGIDPPVTTVKIQRGDEGDLQRLMYALLSNEGSKPYTADERKRIVHYLHQVAPDWNQQQIGDALRMSRQRVSQILGPTQVASTSNLRRGGNGKKRFTDAECVALAKEHESAGVAKIARRQGCAWDTANTAILRGQQLLSAPESPLQNSAAPRESCPCPASPNCPCCHD